MFTALNWVSQKSSVSRGSSVLWSHGAWSALLTVSAMRFVFSSEELILHGIITLEIKNRE